MRRLLLPLFGLLLLTLPSVASAQEAVTLQATGYASYRADDPARSREEALEAAFRDAVEQASGMLITTATETRNFELVRDEVLSRSQGYIRDHTVLAEGRDGNLYQVRIRAVVVRQAFIAGLTDSLEALYQRVGMPRLLVHVREVITGPEGGPGPGVVAPTVREVLLQRGFTFMDAGGIPADADSDAVLAHAAEGKAELVVLGRAEADPKGEKDHFQVVDATVKLDVLRPGTGQVLVSQTATARGLHPDRATAARRALQQAAESAVPKLTEQLSYQWLKDRNAGALVELVVTGVDFGDVAAVRQALGNMVAGVDAVRQRAFDEGRLVLELQTRDTAERLAERLHGAPLDGFTLAVAQVAAGRITTALSKP